MKKEDYIQTLLGEMAERANPERAQKMKAYMRDQFAFFGIMATERKEIAKPYFLKESRPSLNDLCDVVLTLWDVEQREVQQLAMELVDKYKKELKVEHFDLLEKMIVRKSWWDTVDYIAATLVGNLVKRFPEEGYQYIEKWRNSGNMWLVRTCIIFQLKYKKELDEALLFSLIEENSEDKEFFIRKAIGWSLRQYGKYKPERVIDFVESHELSGLSRREAMKNLK
jgi:3-methyladenine DNA glycosylase AlkD